ncbi:hypothetical protein ACG5V6_01940 [Streptomyces chitinivorans]|uniref:SnoaL-like domain-containing protein n=1 Tax=Streptomyces chitinivorans TaxID=1257027 RepID=A0ABW7HNH5_9ACTN|nr:hypothetical protein [Streptomyces chitinivorans]MDH2410835.1 hypothetical protein [Streptomyces chitinivorans]
METNDPRAQLADLFMQHMANLLDQVVNRDDFVELAGSYLSGDLAIQIHDGELVLAHRDIGGVPDTIPPEWEGGVT